jgi:hypothetical protein
MRKILRSRGMFERKTHPVVCYPLTCPARSFFMIFGKKKSSAVAGMHWSVSARK